MIKAALILVSAGSLAAMEFVTPPRGAKPVDQLLAPSIVGTSDSRDTLATTDRLEIPYDRNGLRVRQASAVVGRVPLADAAPASSKAVSRIGSGNRHDPRIKNVAAVAPKPRPKSTVAKPGAKTTDS